MVVCIKIEVGSITNVPPSLIYEINVVYDMIYFAIIFKLESNYLCNNIVKSFFFLSFLIGQKH